MQIFDSTDESAYGLALVGVLIVGMAVFLGEVTGRVQPTAPVVMTHTDVSSPDLRHGVASPQPRSNESSSPYPQPDR